MNATGRRLLPREHGAYAQLALPLFTALTAARPGVSSACYALAACAAFVAHEPSLVLLGQRGTRARRESAARARRWLAVAVTLGTVLGAIAFVLSPPSRLSVLFPAALGIASGVVVLGREERSLAGESVASAALASAAVPTAIASGVAWRDAFGLWSVFFAGFLVCTVEVRAVAHRGANRLVRLATWGAALAIIGLVAAERPLLALAPLPIVVVVVCVVARAPSAAALRGLGWTLATSSLLTAIAASAALRLAHAAAPANLADEKTGAYTAK